MFVHDLSSNLYKDELRLMYVYLSWLGVPAVDYLKWDIMTQRQRNGHRVFFHCGAYAEYFFHCGAYANLFINTRHLKMYHVKCTSDKSNLMTNLLSYYQWLLHVQNVCTHFKTIPASVLVVHLNSLSVSLWRLPSRTACYKEKRISVYRFCNQNTCLYNLKSLFANKTPLQYPSTIQTIYHNRQKFTFHMY